MFYAEKRRKILSRGIMSFWTTWAIGIGSLAVLILLAPLFAAKYAPAVAVALIIILIYLERNNSLAKCPACFKVPYLVQNVLIVSALILIASVVYVNTFESFEFTGAPFNVKNPLLPIFVVAPVTALFSFHFMVKQRRSSFCRNCSFQKGEAYTHGIYGILNRRESAFQIKLLFWISASLTVVVWAYYFTQFINININDADMFFLVWMPAGIYVLSLLYLAARYYNLWVYYCVHNGLSEIIGTNGSVLRFLIIHNENLLLATPTVSTSKPLADDNKVDTPMKIVMPFRESLPVNEAHSMFVETTGIRNAEIISIYESHDSGMYNNLFHFAAFVDDPNQATELIGGEWYSLNEVKSMLRNGDTSATLVAEFDRIHTIATTAKTYDYRGYRRYNIKSYHPSFHLSDIRNADIDFGDINWLYISTMNQDKPLFRFHRLMSRLLRAST